MLFGWSDNEEADLDRAFELAHKALALDDSNTWALAALCEGHWLQRRFNEAVVECNWAVQIDPNYATGYEQLSSALNVRNEWQEAVRAAEKAMRLDPTRRDFYAFFIAAPYTNMGRYQDAIPLLKRHLAAYPNQPWGHALLAISDIELGRAQEARAEAVELKRISPQFLAHVGVTNNAALNKRMADDLRKAGMQ
ncbi:MAG: tetratricopeptide repeat protein [Deltaproteobacteria bacterium]|nr:tetratricopeptide repeat protein [Deltaproteobacteria bacterium]